MVKAIKSVWIIFLKRKIFGLLHYQIVSFKFGCLSKNVRDHIIHFQKQALEKIQEEGKRAFDFSFDLSSLIQHGRHTERVLHVSQNYPCYKLHYAHLF